MHFVEIRQTLVGTSVEKDIYESNKIITQLVDITKITNDLSYTDFAYISALLSKSKTLLYRAYTIFKLNNEEVQKNGK